MRFTVRAELWAILGLRRIRRSEFGRHLPNSPQWLSHVHRHPEATVSEEWALAAAAYLDVPMSLLFDPAVLDTQPATQRVA